jgi:hypothetical protein
MEDLSASQRSLWRMPASGMLRRVAPIRTNDMEEISASIIRMTRIGEPGRTYFLERRLLVTDDVPCSPILIILMMDALSSSEMLVFTRATQRNIPEDTFLYAYWCLGKSFVIIFLNPIRYYIDHNQQQSETLPSAHTVYLSAPYCSHNKQRMLP